MEKYYVFGTKKSENAGNILYTGNINSCIIYSILIMDTEDWYELNVCDDAGKIVNRIIDPEPFR